MDLGKWNADASRRWSRFLQELSRFVGADQVTYDAAGKRHRRQGLVYFRAVEVQRRGALHFHVLMRRRDGAPLAITVHDFRRLAIRHGFGHSVDVQAVQPGHATYVAKYVAKSSNDRKVVPWSAERWVRPKLRAHKVVRVPFVDETGRQVAERSVIDTRTGELVSPAARALVSMPTFRTWAASWTWGDRMRDVLAAQQHWTLVVAALPIWGMREGEGWAAVRSAVEGWGRASVPDRPDC
ncbi:replication initiator [Cellulomonas sp. RIT-PI-Y]|uniref:replication initiator n=1 Tax=Cellulomonas sp. RIT-PI-Y TaxID=3035297 RepID=UPI0021DA18BC|nr:replication initiator [Cellulomonas sp. RIT-PI-Y]